MKYFFILYIFLATLLAWWDFDFDAEDQQTIRKSLVLQTLYMNDQQKILYIEDLELAKNQIEIFEINGMEAHQIQEIANQVRINRKLQPVEYPSKSFMESLKLYILMPYFMATAD